MPPLSHAGPSGGGGNLFHSAFNKPTGKTTPAKRPPQKPTGTGRLAIAMKGLNPQQAAEQNPQFGSGSRQSGMKYGRSSPSNSTPSGSQVPTRGLIRPPLAQRGYQLKG